MLDETQQLEGTSEVESGSDQNVEAQAETQDTDTETTVTTPGQQAQPEKEESFISPNELPEELKPHWKRMHRAYTKHLEAVKGIREQAAQVERFYNDRSFAYQTLANWAVQNGYTLTPAGQQAPQQTQAQQNVQAPPQLVEAIRSKLSPELKWMAEQQAEAFWAAQQLAYQPVIEQQQRQQQQALSAEYDQLSDELSNVSPGWEEHEQDMREMYDFLQSPKLRHPKYGSKLQLLHNLITSNASAIAEATGRMNKAVKNRSAGSHGSTTRVVSNLSDRIRKASNNDAWDLAARAALGNSPREE